MEEKKVLINSTQLSELVVEGMLEKKAEKIIVLDLRGINGAVADYFVICSGNTDTHVDAIASSVDEVVYKSAKEDPWHKEGFVNKEWILLDYSDVVVHVFKAEKRSFFNLENLWGDGKVIAINAEVEEGNNL